MKRLTQTLVLCLLTAFPALAQKNYVSEVWVSDLGNGKYKNPVLYADYSDPDACRFASVNNCQHTGHCFLSEYCTCRRCLF